MAINVFLDFGDSNAVGLGMSAATLPAGLQGYDYGATYSFGQGATWWGAYQPGVNSGTPNHPEAWGGEAEFLKRVHEANPGDTNLIISVAHGSTPLAQDGAVLDWSPASAREMYQAAADTLAAARAAFLAANGYAMPAVTAVLWTGGPNDATDAAKAQAYEANLTDLFAHVRGDLLGQPAAEIVFDRMTDDATALPYNFDVRVAQWTVDQLDPHATSFKTIGDDMQADHIHYSAAGYVQLGDGFFDAWAAIA